VITPVLGCIADDYTGASDLSSMLVRTGLRVIQCFGVPAADLDVTGHDAVVVALKSRSVAPVDAVRLSLQALEALKAMPCQRYFFKYCSTFDSTPHGNIGPVADALADALDADSVLFCPSFPENGRTVYSGYLFVEGVPLHESSMRHHPLNPMTDSNLVRVLATQSSRPVSLWEYASQKRPSGHLIVDAIDDQDLEAVADAAAEDILLTGGSPVAAAWAGRVCDGTAADVPQLRSSEPVSDGAANAAAASRLPRFVVLAGSCSKATRAQIEEFRQLEPMLRLDVDAAVRGDDVVGEAVRWCEQYHNQKAVLICSAPPTLDGETAANHCSEDAAKVIENTFAGIARQLVEGGLRRLIVAGGETSGAVINALRIRAVRIGREVAPGVPWIHSQSEPPVSLALKSGNFGGRGFFHDAMRLAE